jgi:subtilisin family serine protease
VRVAVIDSGAAAGTHRNLTTIRRGFDVVHESSSGWDQDTIGHGSHCAGIICGADDEGVGIRGFAPEAEMHILKIFPGGRLSDLIGALDYCMQNDIDVVSLGLVSEQASEIVEQRLQKAASLGIACIAPAGNLSGPVLYPARSANVLAVSAIGKGGEFPSDSYHAQLPVGLGQPNGFFFPRFSCFGPEVAVAGPGVAVVSSIPPNDFSARDGTSVAAAHIVGLAALVLAHNPDFETAFGQRNAARVGHLFDVLKQSAQPLNLGDRHFTGAGLPDAVMALQPRAMVAGWAGTLTQDQQAEIGRRVAEAVRHAVQSATFRPAGWAATVGPGQYSPGPSHPGLAAAWPPSPRH